jgi:hypothetical protein
MGGSTKTETTKSSTNAWEPGAQAAREIMERAQGLDGATFAPTQSAWTQQGLAGLANLGKNPFAAEGAYTNLADETQRGFGVGNDALMSTASGGMLNGNPYLDSVLSNSRERAMEDVAGRFSAAGRYGSNASFGRALGDAMSRADTTIRAQNYDTERGRQLSAAGQLQSSGLRSGEFASGADAARAGQIEMMLRAGNAQDAYDQAQRQAPYTALQAQAGLTTPFASLGSTTDGTRTTSTPANIPGMVMGAGMAGLGLATGNPQMVMGGLGGLGGFDGGSGGGSQMSGSGQPFFGMFNGGGGSNLGSTSGLGGSALTNNWGNVGQSSVGPGGLPALGRMFGR